MVTPSRALQISTLLFTIILALAAVFGFVSRARAAVSSNVAASLTTQNQTIKASSTPVAIISLNLAGDQTLASTSIAFTGSGGFSTTTDLAILANATSSGVAVYRDIKGSGTPGSFDAGDVVVPLLMASTSWNGSTTTLTFATPEIVPANDTGGNAGADYFIVIQTTAGATNSHAFTASIYPGSNGWTGAQPAGPSAITTNTVTIDTVAPTLNVNMTGPQNGSTGVPISTFIHFGFSENLDQTTLNSSNVTLTTSTTTIGTAIRPFPNGFDIIVSNPPTYASGSRFAKASTGGSAFLQINGTNQIFPQGSYSAPTAGDIVYMQMDTFPPEVGIVTDATLTSGTFAVNGFALFRPLQLTKFASATATGNVSGGASTGVGDMLLVNTSANPSDFKYNWHIVTTAAAVNNASLRLDGASAAPTYATTTFSRLMPTATSTVDGSGVLTASTTFAVGNLVFAKLTAGGDNLNAYAWHLVTAVTGAGILGPQAGGGTVSFDGGSPTFAASSVVAKLTTSAQGAVDTGTQDATSFSFGDLVFAKATANAGNTGSYAFHLVSNGATGATSTSLRFDNSASNLIPSTAYTVTAGTGVKDSAGNSLASSAAISFTTGATGGTNTTPPYVQSSQPQSGNQQFAPNGKIKLTFSVAMLADGGANAVDTTTVVKLSTASNGQPGSAVTATNAYDSSTNTVTITPSANLSVNTDYVVQVTTAARSSNGTSLPGEYRLYFRTAAALDTTAPTVLGVNPANGSTNISVSQVFTSGFSKDMDPSTISGSTVKLLAQAGGASVAGSVSYNPQSRSINFAPSTVLSTATGYKLQIGAGLTGPADIAGNRLTATSTTYATTTPTADTSAPTVTFANADNFGVAISFSETMRTGGSPNAVDNIANYTIESPTGTSISLGGKTVTYDPGTRTARISGLSLQNGNTFKVTIATPVQDLAGNGISTSGTPAGNLAYGTVQSSSDTGGSLGPGGGTIDQGQQGMNPIRVTPQTRMTGIASNYQVQFPVSTSVPVGGQVVLTFPSGFDVTNAAMVSTSSSASFCNTDINGPGSGAPYILNVTNDANAVSVTLTIAGASTGANAFLCMDLSGVVNSTVPSSTGYQVDIKTRDTAGNNRALLETKTAAPFFLGAAGSRTLAVNVFNDFNSNSAVNAGEGIANVKVFLFSPSSGGQATTTSASGVGTFTSLADGDYMIGIDPGSLATASSTVTYNGTPQPFTVSSTNLTKNVIVSGAGSTVTISGSVTGPAGTSVDIFAGSPSGFSKKTVALTGGADAYSLSVQMNTTYNVGVGPAMPDAAFIPGAPPPPPPTFTFMPPPPLTVIVGTTSVSAKNFTLSATSKTITGSVLDANGSAVSNAGVFARPVATSTASDANGFGTGGQTNTSGAFTLNVTPGTYLVGVFKPGMPSVPDQQIVVPSSGSNSPTSLTFKLGVGSSLTISGTVKDNSGNAIPYAGVSGRKITSTSDTTPIGGGQGNFVGGPTDANGAYTLYVTNGIWQIESYAPGFGKLGSKTVTVSGSSLSGQDFSAQTLALGTITGSTTQASVGIQGVIIRAEGSSGANTAISDANGSYTLKVPAGSYTLTCVFPGVGDSTPTSGVTVTDGGTTTGQNCALAAPIAVTVKLTDGTNPITNAFVDARTSTGRGNGTGANTVSGIYGVYTLSLSPGTYTVRAGSPAFGPIGSTGSVSTTQTIIYTSSRLYTVTGSVSVSGSSISGAWVSLTGIPTGQSNTIVVGAQADANGAYSISIPAGSYQIRADKPGYISSAPSAVTVSGDTSGINISLTTASQTITGTVTLSGSGVSGAFVDATNGSGGFSVAQTDSSGTYSLPVSSGTWTLTAHSIGYTGSLSGISAGATGQTITLSAITGFTVKAERQETVTPTAGGLLTNSDIGDAFKLNIPANALGTGSNAGTVKTQANTALPNVANGTVLAKNGISISAVDSSGQPVKNLNDSVTVVVPYTESDIPSGKTESDLQLGVWNDASQAYDILSTTVDTTNNTLTATVSHFSDFAPIAPAQSSTPSSSTAAPAAASGNGAPVSGGGGVGVVVKPRAQIIYPDGRIEYLDQMSGVAAEAPSSLSKTTRPTIQDIHVGAFVSARFLASLKQGSRGADVSRLQSLLGIEATGYFGPKTAQAIQDFQIKHGVAKKGQDGFGQLGPKTRARIEEVFGSGVASSNASLQGQMQSGNAAMSVGTFTRSLAVGMTGDDVKLLQTVLNGDPDTQLAASGDGSLGFETMKVGRLTIKAIQKFQVKWGIAKPDADGFGTLGPKTRAKLNAILREARDQANVVAATMMNAVPVASTTTATTTSASSVMATTTTTTTTVSVTASSTTSGQ
ncbi:Ig-like domain-containing protein [Candidatus Kaiserbacteria bacterium]|nr:Ig-like domain-containing protein [Candidatus Kaiserbacteria bacterium]